ADPPEVVALRVEEDPLQREARGLEIRRLAGAQEGVDRLERLLLGLRRILPQRVLEQRALATPHLDAAREDLDLLDPRPAQAVVDLRRQLLRGLDQDLTGFGVDDVPRDQRPVRLPPLRARLDTLREIQIQGRVEEPQDRIVGAVAEGPEERRGRELLLLVDVDV